MEQLGNVPRPYPTDFDPSYLTPNFTDDDDPTNDDPDFEDGQPPTPDIADNYLG